MSDRNDRYRLSQLLFAGLLSAAFHAGFAPAAGSQPPPSLFVGAAEADVHVELAVHQWFPGNVTADDQTGMAPVKLLALVDSPLVSQVRSTASCSRYGMVREALACAIGWGVPMLRAARTARRVVKLIRKDSSNVFDIMSLALGTFFCAEFYQSYEFWEQCRRESGGC